MMILTNKNQIFIIPSGQEPMKIKAGKIMYAPKANHSKRHVANDFF